MQQFWTVAALSAAITVSAPLAAHATSFSFSGSLSGAQEAPAPNNSPATGTFNALLEGEPDNWTFKYEVSAANLTGLFRDGHIHLGGRGVAGPVVHPLDGVPELVAADVNNVTLTGDWTSAELPSALAPATVFQRFLDGQYYFNIHSTTFRAGEIRGQIEDPTAVPEPSAALGLVAIGIAGAVLRRNKAKQAV